MKISNQDRAYLRIAYEMAALSQCRWRLGSCLVRAGNVLAAAPNKIRHHPRDIQVYTVHSEKAALNIAKNTTKSTIYVVRIGARGELRMARPCSCCLKSLVEAGVNRVVWSTCDNDYESARIRDLVK